MKKGEEMVALLERMVREVTLAEPVRMTCVGVWMNKDPVVRFPEIFASLPELKTAEPVAKIGAVILS